MSEILHIANDMAKDLFKVGAMLGIGKTNVQQWERGEKKPNGAAQRLLDLVDRKGLKVLS